MYNLNMMEDLMENSELVGFTSPLKSLPKAVTRHKGVTTLYYYGMVYINRFRTSLIIL